LPEDGLNGLLTFLVRDFPGFSGFFRVIAFQDLLNGGTCPPRAATSQAAELETTEETPLPGHNSD